MALMAPCRVMCATCLLVTGVIAKDFRFAKDFPLIRGKSFAIMTLACLDIRKTQTSIRQAAGYRPAPNSLTR
jgi:hypothetical protein